MFLRRGIFFSWNCKLRGVVIGFLGAKIPNEKEKQKKTSAITNNRIMNHVVGNEMTIKDML